jgi:hypothetical protein
MANKRRASDRRKQMLGSDYFRFQFSLSSIGYFKDSCSRFALPSWGFRSGQDIPSIDVRQNQAGPNKHRGATHAELWGERWRAWTLSSVPFRAVKLIRDVKLSTEGAPRHGFNQLVVPIRDHALIARSRSQLPCLRLFSDTTEEAHCWRNQWFRFRAW